MTKQSHEKALSDAQHHLNGAKLAYEKLDGSMEKLYATLEDVEKDLKVLTFKKKVTALLNHIKRSCPKVKRMSPSRRARFYIIETNNVMSNNEVERLVNL